MPEVVKLEYSPDGITVTTDAIRTLPNGSIGVVAGGPLPKAFFLPSELEGAAHQPVKQDGQPSEPPRSIARDLATILKALETMTRAKVDGFIAKPNDLTEHAATLARQAAAIEHAKKEAFAAEEARQTSEAMKAAAEAEHARLSLEIEQMKTALAAKRAEVSK